MANLLLDGMHNAPAVSQCRGSDDGAHFHLVFAEQVITAQTTLQLSGYKPGMNVESLSKADDTLFSKKWCDTCDEAIHFLFGHAKLGACRIGDDFFLAVLIRRGAFEVLIQNGLVATMTLTNMFELKIGRAACWERIVHEG